MPNTDLAYRVLDRIDADPSAWMQSAWYMETSCGTRACFAGYTILLSGGKLHDTLYNGVQVEIDTLSPEAAAAIRGLMLEPTAKWAGPFTAGRALLEVTTLEARNLFNGGNDRNDLGGIVEEVFGKRPAVANA